MYIVIFKAVVRQTDDDYRETAAKLRMVAESFGCTGFESTCENGHEIALSYWPDLESIRKWKQQSDHLIAQQKGKSRWYSSYTVEIAEITRAYSNPPDAKKKSL